VRDETAAAADSAGRAENVPGEGGDPLPRPESSSILGV